MTHTLGVGNAISCLRSSKKAPVTLLLFDLDDTLLGNVASTFVPAYMQAMSIRLARVADPPEFIRILLAAVRQMKEKPGPTSTLE